MVPWLISVVQIQLPRSCPQKLLQAGLQSRCGVYTNSPLPSSPLVQLPGPLLQPDLRTPPCSQAAVSIGPVQSPFPRTSNEKCPSSHTLNQEPHCQDFFFNFIDQKTMRRKDRSTHCWDSLRRKFQLYRCKDKEWWKLEKKLSQNWKRRRSPSYSNENARHHLFCSFIHQTCIDLAGVWVRSCSPTSQTDSQTLKPLPSCQIHVSVNGKSQAALTSVWALPEVTGWGWGWEWGCGGVGKNWFFSVSVDGG